MSAGKSESACYRVEARCTGNTPSVYGGVLLDNRWTDIPISQAPAGFGVPNHTFSNAGSNGYLSYEAAQCLRWAFHAAEPFPFCIETRLVAYDYKESWSAIRKSASSAQEWPRRPWDEFEPVARDSDEHPKGEDAQRLSGGAMPARAGGIAQPQSPNDHSEPKP